jgi:hypothetical protein
MTYQPKVTNKTIEMLISKKINFADLLCNLIKI